MWCSSDILHQYKTLLSSTPRCKPDAKLLLLFFRRLGGIDRLIDPPGSHAVGDGRKGTWRADVPESLRDKDRSCFAFSARARYANHKRRTILTRMRLGQDLNSKRL